MPVNGSENLYQSMTENGILFIIEKKLRGVSWQVVKLSRL